MNIRNWLKKLLEPANLIALGSLFVLSFSVFAGVKLFSNNQKVTGDNGCEIDKIEQEITSDTNSNQTVECNNNSKITGVTQRQMK